MLLWWWLKWRNLFHRPEQEAVHSYQRRPDWQLHQEVKEWGVTHSWGWYLKNQRVVRLSNEPWVQSHCWALFARKLLLAILGAILLPRSNCRSSQTRRSWKHEKVRHLESWNSTVHSSDRKESLPWEQRPKVPLQPNKERIVALSLDFWKQSADKLARLAFAVSAARHVAQVRRDWGYQPPFLRRVRAT